MKKINNNKIKELEKIIEDRNVVEKTSGTAFGLETVTGINNFLVNVINNMIEEEAITTAVDILNNVQEEQPKVSNLWDKYIPNISSKSEFSASKFVMNDNLSSQPWKHFLNDPEIEKALVEDVGLTLLEDLSNIGDFLDNESKLIDEWKTLRPGIYSFAKRCVDDSANRVFSLDERSNSNNKDGIEAYKLTRMAAYRVLDAHFTGNTEYEMSPELGGSQSISVRIKSDAFSELEKTDAFAAKQLQFVKIGKVKNVVYDLPEKRKFSKVFETLLKETDPKSFKSNDKAFNMNHPVNILSKKICPIFAREPMYFRQKNFDPEVAYKLYSASKKLSFLSYSSLYPLLGTGTVPKQLPPNFVERFSKEWREEKGVGLNELAYAGFSPIVHVKLKEIVNTLFKDLPDMADELMSHNTLNKLKLARTNDIVVKPLKASAIQRVISVAFKEEFPDEFNEILERKERELHDLKETDIGSYIVKLRANVAKECIDRVQNDPKKDIVQLENRLLCNRKDNIVEVSINDDIKWARGVIKKSSVDVNL